MVAMASVADLVAARIERWHTASVEQGVFRTADPKMVAAMSSRSRTALSGQRCRLPCSTDPQRDVSLGSTSTTVVVWS
jgi:hypothetical protein